MLKKILATTTLFLFTLLGVHPLAHAAVQIGAAARFHNEQFQVDTAHVTGWFTEHFALRGDYSWNTEELGLAALYTVNPDDPVALYLGLAQNDIAGTGTPGILPDKKPTSSPDWSGMYPGQTPACPYLWRPESESMISSTLPALIPARRRKLVSR